MVEFFKALMYISFPYFPLSVLYSLLFAPAVTTSGSCSINQLSLIVFDKGSSLDKFRVRLNKDSFASGLFQGSTRQSSGNESSEELQTHFVPSGGCLADNFPMIICCWFSRLVQNWRRGNRNGTC